MHDRQQREGGLCDAPIAVGEPVVPATTRLARRSPRRDLTWTFHGHG